VSIPEPAPSAVRIELPVVAVDEEEEEVLVIADGFRCGITAGKGAP
jgi:hypothetical protein